MSKPVAYIAGQLSADPANYIKNIRKMIVLSEKVRRKGFAVIVPGLDFLTGLVMGDMSYDDFFQNSLCLMLKSDLVVFGDTWRHSKGAKGEHAVATKHRKPVFYENSLPGLDEMCLHFAKDLGPSVA